MGTITLTELHYSDDHTGPWKLYVYAKDRRGYEVAQWFAKSVRRHDEDISVIDAFSVAKVAEVKYGKEVKVCDGGDFIVYHSKDGNVLYGETFWQDVLEIKND